MMNPTADCTISSILPGMTGFGPRKRLTGAGMIRMPADTAWGMPSWKLKQRCPVQTRITASKAPTGNRDQLVIECGRLTGKRPSLTVKFRAIFTANEVSSSRVGNLASDLVGAGIGPGVDIACDAGFGVVRLANG